MRTFTNRSHQNITSVSESTVADTETVGAVKGKDNQEAILEMLRTLNSYPSGSTGKEGEVRGTTTVPTGEDGGKQ